MKIFSLAVSIFLLSPLHSFASSADTSPPTPQQCAKCTPELCGKDKNMLGMCRRCDINNDKFEACREAAEKAGFLKQTFNTSLNAADSNNVTAKDVIPKLENLKQLIWAVQKRITFITDQSKKQNFQQSTGVILASWQDYRNKTGLNTNTDPARLIKWSPEVYSNLLSSAKTYNGLTCDELQKQTDQMLKSKSDSITNKSKTLNNAQKESFKKLHEMTKDQINFINNSCQALKGLHDVEEQIKTAQDINSKYSEFAKTLDQIK